MESGIQYLRELGMWEMIYYDLNNAQLPTDPDEGQCARPMWRKFVRRAPSSYANSLAVMEWKGKERSTVNEVAAQLRQYEESISSPLVSAVKKLSGKVILEENMSFSPPVEASISAVRSRCFSTQEREHREDTPRGTLWFCLRDHRKDMRKWDGQPTSILQAWVQELQGRPTTKRDLSRKSATPVSSGQFPRQSRRPDLTSNPLEGTSKSFLQEWKQSNWQRRGKPIWAAELWQDIAAWVENLVVKVHHVDAHVPSRATEEHQNNQQVDRAAKTEVAEVDLDWQHKGELFIARWAHDSSGHQGRDATYRWAHDRGVVLTMDTIAQVIHECETCAAIKQAKRLKPLWYGGRWLKQIQGGLAD
ncbi:hypothetical protein llap_6150 [Limosa lapponica baueri]|uniref:Integrase zinc-binding domain-containing protein n=1 Tax=Limosa lapponica baueri TaxID=1758121 RepID=A0A2I0UBW0_LIMLA|nr:hypothetical protein llap_6150 [Limosa lapponica baueri]